MIETKNLCFAPAADLVEEIVTTGQNLNYKKKLELLDKVIEAKSKVEDNKVQKMMQSKKFNIGKMINKVKAKREGQRAAGISEQPLPPAEEVSQTIPSVPKLITQPSKDVNFSRSPTSMFFLRRANSIRGSIQRQQTEHFDKGEVISGRS